MEKMNGLPGSPIAGVIVGGVPKEIAKTLAHLFQLLEAHREENPDFDGKCFYVSGCSDWKFRSMQVTMEVLHDFETRNSHKKDNLFGQMTKEE